MENTSTQATGEKRDGTRSRRYAHWSLQWLTWGMLLAFGIGGTVALRSWSDDLALAWTLHTIRDLDADMDVDTYGVEFMDGGEVQVVRILHAATEPASDTQPDATRSTVAATR